MSSNKEKSPVWGIVTTVILGLTAFVTFYSLLSFIGASALNFAGGDEFWAYASQFNLPTVDPKRAFGSHHFVDGAPVRVFNLENLPHMIKDLLFNVSLLCLIVFCVLAIIKKDKKNKAVNILLLAFAALQFISYALQIILLIKFFAKVPLGTWEYHLSTLGFSPTYFWECAWRILVCVVLILYALRSFVPAIDNLLSGGAKNTISNICVVLFLLCLAFLPITSLQNVHYYRVDESLHMPFYIATLWVICQSAVFVWFIKE